MLVQQRTDHLLSLKSLLNRNFCLSPNRNELKRISQEDIDAFIRNEHLNLSAKTNIDVQTGDWFLNHAPRLVKLPRPTLAVVIITQTLKRCKIKIKNKKRPMKT